MLENVADKNIATAEENCTEMEALMVTRGESTKMPLERKVVRS